MNVFLDTNVVIDFMGERDGFFENAATIFSMIEDGFIQASVSSLTIVNCAYILKKAFSSDIMYSKIESLCKILDVTPIEKAHLQNAIALKPYDYEDAVQYLSSQNNQPDVIITRDKRGFQEFGIRVMSPAEFVSEVKG